MFLKKLELFGFKSFPHKTTLTFEPGVTGVVGPNGCGKSNISDAIKWVLGEQSAKQMRGTRMADVLFSGTDKMPAFNVAEVSMTFDNESQLLPVEYNEVTITRRMTRMGQSDYFINKNPCRLKDIHQMFLGTGVGTSAYSVIEQGRIGQIINMKSEDRRYIFEEAAGITKYKAHKKEALRKLAATEQNLLRVADVVLEIKRQLNSINRQVNKARRYKEFYSALRDFELKIFYKDMSDLSSVIRKICEDKKTMREKEERLTTDSIRQEAKIEEIRHSLHELSDTLQTLNQQYVESDKKMSLWGSKLDFNKDRICEIESNSEHIIEENIRSEKKLSDWSTQIEEIKRGLAELNSQNENSSKNMNQINLDLSQAQDNIQGKEKEMEYRESEYVDIQSQLAKVTNAIEAIKTSMSHVSDRKEKVVTEESRQKDKKSSLAEDLRLKKDQLDVLLNEIESLEDTHLTQACNIEANLTYLEETRKSFEDVVKEREICRSRLELLEQLRMNHEGYVDGVKAALDCAEKGVHREHVHGALAGMVVVDEKYTLAVESALRYDLQIIVVDQDENAKGLIDELYRTKKGNAKFFVRSADVSASDENAHYSLWNRPGVCGRAIDFVRYEDQNLCVLEAFLKNTLVVDNDVTARAVLTDRVWGGRIVTLRGECFDDGGRILWGGSPDAQSKDLLMRDTQIGDLRKDFEDYAVRENELKEKVESIRKTTQVKEEEKLSVQDKLEELGLQKETLEKERAHLKWQNEHMSDEIFILESESNDLNKNLAEYVELLKEKESALETLDTDEAIVKTSIEQIKQDIECMKTKREELRETTTTLKVNLAGIREKLTAESSRLERLNLRNQEERTQIETKNVHHRELTSRREALLLESGEIQGKLQNLRGEIETLKHELERQTQKKDEAEVQLDNEMTGLKIAQQELRQSQTMISAKEIEETEKKMSFENQDNLIHNTYQIRFADLPPEYHVTEIPAEWIEKRDTLKSKVESIGPVNEDVIEENEELEIRYKFLIEQQDDLVEAKESLQKVIRKINATTKKQFIETFQSVRRHFSEYFKILFDGGQADLVLVDEDNVLESGVDIMARPPGKKMQNITLMSGGEKAMTAIAILFALFTVRPSPFCVLDEIDAPLDDANIDRFVTLLQQFLNKTQFIIISHNKKTISIADTLYGITMEIPGISRLISVKLVEGEEKLAGELTA
ncbi:chromosome segregation protein SMC [PVC group bacterium]|nr:chromosome segregation protein SMC [PVC group bacterium]